MNLTLRSLKFTILTALSTTRHQNRFNLLGRGSEQGNIERQLRIEFEPGERHMAAVALNELESAGLVRPTYDDLISPGAWLEITESGREAVQRRVLDSLDDALGRINTGLVEMRAGAWAAVTSALPDSLRQASHSARELIDQTLKEGAPDEAVRNMSGFAANSSSRSGITRRHRFRYLMSIYHGSVSDSQLRVVEEACDLVLATDERLKALAHSREPLNASEVRDSLQIAEIALRRLLVPVKSAV